MKRKHTLYIPLQYTRCIPTKWFVWTHVFHGSDTAKTSTATLICLQDEAQTMRQRVAAPQVDEGPKGVPKQHVSTVKNPLQ